MLKIFFHNNENKIIVILNCLYMFEKGVGFMDISSMAIAMHQDSLQNKVGVAVMKLAMDDKKELANQTVEMLNNMAVDGNRGSKIDVRA